MNKKITKRTLQSAIVAYGLMITGCEYLGPQVGITYPLLNPDTTEKPSTKPKVGKDGKESKDGDVVFKQLKNQDDNVKFAKPKAEQYPGSGQFVDGAVNPTEKPKDTAGKYSLNFDDADLGEVSKIILSDMLGQNYVMNPAVSGKVTLQTTQPLTKEELMPTLEMLLRMNDVALVKSDGIYRIEPNAKALQAASSPSVGKSLKAMSPGFQTKVIPLRYVGVTDMMEILTPLLPDKSVVRADPARNILLVSGAQFEIERILDIVKTFDVNYMAGLSFGLFPLENVDATETITQLEAIFNKEDKSPMNGMIRFVPVKHLNAILVGTHQPQYIEEAKAWVSRLDKPGTAAAEGGVVVYRVQHVDATELAATLTSIFSGTSTPKTPSSSPSTAPGSQTSTLTNKPANTPTTPTQVAKKTGTGTGNTENELSGAQVIADEANNALVITAKPQQYRLVKKIIQELDVMPLQVLIDATIIAVKLTDKLEYGVKYMFENHDSSQDYSGVGGFNTGKLGGTVGAAAVAAGTGGLSYAFITSDGNPRFVIDMLAAKTNVSVLSSPSLMVLNNKEAKFHVGDSVPYQTGTSLQTGVVSGGATGSSGYLSQNTQIKTGVDLQVKPRVNANGIVIMDITQKVDNVKPNSNANSLTPTILEREIKSSVAVVSGETVVLGGLISEEDTGPDKTGIPLLMDIPYIGSLFSSTLKNKNKDELIILITPRVVENKYDARKVAYEFKQRVPGIFYDMHSNPDGKPLLGKGVISQ